MQGRHAQRSLGLGIIGVALLAAAMSGSQSAALRALPGAEQVGALRNIAAQQADWGTTATQLNDRVFEKDLASLATTFHSDQGTVMCQGASYYLQLLYGAAGFRSYMVGFSSGDFSHAMVLVEIARPDGSRALIVEDPTFNVTYTDASGMPMSIQEILSAISRGEPDAIHIKQGPSQLVDFLCGPDDADPSLDEFTYVTPQIPPIVTSSGWRKFKARITLETCAKAYAPLIEKRSAARGLPPNILTIIFDNPLYVLGRLPMSSAEKADADRIFAQLVKLRKDDDHRGE